MPPGVSVQGVGVGLDVTNADAGRLTSNDRFDPMAQVAAAAVRFRVG